MRFPPFREIVGGTMAVSGLLALIYLATVLKSDAATGALVTLVAGASGWLYRGRVADPRA